MEYTPIRITTLKIGKLLTFDLYIFFKEQYLKYLDNGKTIEDSLMKKLSAQKVARFYITDEDEENYEIKSSAVKSHKNNYGELIKAKSQHADVIVID